MPDLADLYEIVRPERVFSATIFPPTEQSTALAGMPLFLSSSLIVMPAVAGRVVRLAVLAVEDCAGHTGLLSGQRHRA